MNSDTPSPELLEALETLNKAKSHRDAHLAEVFDEARLKMPPFLGVLLEYWKNEFGQRIAQSFDNSKPENYLKSVFETQLSAFEYTSDRYPLTPFAKFFFCVSDSQNDNEQDVQQQPRHLCVSENGQCWEKGASPFFLRAPEEFWEFSDYATEQPDLKSDEIQWKYVPASTLIDDVLIEVSPENEEAYLIDWGRNMNRFTEPRVGQDARALAEEYYPYFCGAPTDPIFTLGDSEQSLSDDQWSSFTAEAKTFSNGVRVTPDARDLVILGENVMVTRTMVPLLEDGGEKVMKTILRPSKKFTISFLLDYFHFSDEGIKLLSKFKENPMSWRKQLKALQVPIPATWNEQLCWSLEARRQQTASTMEFNFSQRDCDGIPASELLPLLKEQTNLLASWTNDGGGRRAHYKERLRSRSPMPFLLEFPYRRYCNSNYDVINQMRYAQVFLNTILKTLVYLPLEEAEANGLSGADTIRAALEKSPPSDGKLAGTLVEMANKLDHENLPIIGHRILSEAAKLKRELLDDWITSRNKLHHGLYDVEQFLETSTRVIPQIEERIRTLFDEVNLIVPISFEAEESDFCLLAYQLNSLHDEFPKGKLWVQDPRNFPTGKLVLHRTTPDGGNAEQTLILEHFFTSSWRTKRVLDVGLFEKYSNEKVVYNWIRES